MSASARIAAAELPDAPLPVALEGTSSSVRRAREALDSAAAGHLLILAEEGLEPGVLAAYLHARTQGRRPFVSIDCARLDPERLEAWLLGNQSRATGDLEILGSDAALLRAGAGTAFLEHIGDLPAVVQRRLARVLRDGEARTDARARMRITARLIASAAPSLPAARDGQFREDLLRRFALQVTLPPLRTRPEDIPAIVQRLAADVAVASGRSIRRFTQPALTVLAAFPWPGNVVELRGALERVLRDVPGDVVRQEDILPTVSVEGLAGRTPLVSLREARRRFEREYIAAVLERHQWRMSDAARTLGIERANLYRKTRQLGISRVAGAGERAR